MHFYFNQAEERIDEMDAAPASLEASRFYPYWETRESGRDWSLCWSKAKNAQQIKAQAAPMHQPPRTSVG